MFLPHFYTQWLKIWKYLSLCRVYFLLHYSSPGAINTKKKGTAASNFTSLRLVRPSVRWA